MATIQSSFTHCHGVGLVAGVLAGLAFDFLVIDLAAKINEIKSHWRQRRIRPTHQHLPQRFILSTSKPFLISFSTQSRKHFNFAEADNRPINIARMSVGNSTEKSKPGKPTNVNGTHKMPSIINQRAGEFIICSIELTSRQSTEYKSFDKI